MFAIFLAYSKVSLTKDVKSSDSSIEKKGFHTFKLRDQIKKCEIKMTEIKNLDELRLNYPRVSAIIGKQTEREMRAIPIETLSNAAIRGTKIHAYCSAYLKGLWIPEVEQEYLPYLNAFIGWADENVEKTLHQNKRLYDDKLRFSGEFDCIVLLKDSKKTVMIDIKTSANASKSWPVQLAAYQHLCTLNGYEVETVYNIHLKKTKAAIFDEGSMMLTPPQVKTVEIQYENLTKYWEIFSSALSCFDFFDRKET